MSEPDAVYPEYECWLCGAIGDFRNVWEDDDTARRTCTDCCNAAGVRYCSECHRWWFASDFGGEDDVCGVCENKRSAESRLESLKPNDKSEALT